MDKKNKNSNTKKFIALEQIVILILAIFAFSYVVGSEVGVVEAQFMSQIAKKTASSAFTNTGGPGATLPSASWKLFGETTASTIASVAIYVAATYLVISNIVKYAGGEKTFGEGFQRALPSVLAGTGIGYGLAATELLGTGLLGLLGPIGIGIGIFLWAISYEDNFTRQIDFTCKPWDAPSGGERCDECNKGLLSCTEYQCESLGQGCELINKGTPNELCFWKKVDPNPPVITPWEDALSTGYIYTPDNTISPPDRGVIIKNSQKTNGCVPPYFALQFGITIKNKPARCKIDYIRQANFSRMKFDFGDSSLKLYNHTHIFPVPGTNRTNSPILINGQMNSFYVRCEDENKVSNPADFVFKFCVDPGPDNDAPVIEDTSIINGAAVQFGVGSVNMSIYTNEPANCKWDFLDRSYDDMATQMTCSNKPVQKNQKMVFPCTAVLTGIKDREENNFYFRCEDKTERKNKNPVSYPFVLRGTQALVIDKVGPNGTIKDSTNVTKIKLTARTSSGAGTGSESGKATCQYSDTGKEGDYINFFKTGSFSHEQELGLSQGNYHYYIKCFDEGGNTDTENVTFRVETDIFAPAVVRAFHDSTSLKIITNEEAACVYNTQDEIGCNYEGFGENVKGIPMTTINDKEHFTSWNTLLNFYIKCRDDYGNQPNQDECSIVVRPFNL